MDRIALVSLSAKIHKERAISANSDAMDVVRAHLAIPATTKVDHSMAGKVESRLLSSKHLSMENAKIVQSLMATLGFPTDKGSVARSANPPSDKKQTILVKDVPETATGPSTDIDEEDNPVDPGEVSDEYAGSGWESEPLSGADASSFGEESTGEIPSAAKKTKSLPTSSSTFLPSLAVGFAKGDSDGSDWDEAEEATTPARKNRRGQRARKA